jgi:hypothetical protein
MEKENSIRERVAKDARAKDVERQHFRRWKAGEAYAPHDLSPEEVKKFKKRRSPTMDAFDALGINPLEHYKVLRALNM